MEIIPVLMANIQRYIAKWRYWVRLILAKERLLNIFDTRKKRRGLLALKI